MNVASLKITVLLGPAPGNGVSVEEAIEFESKIVAFLKSLNVSCVIDFTLLCRSAHPDAADELIDSHWRSYITEALAEFGDRLKTRLNALLAAWKDTRSGRRSKVGG